LEPRRVFQLRCAPVWFRIFGVGLIRPHIAPGTIVNADEGPNWNDFTRIELKRINREEAYSREAFAPNW